MNSTEATAKQKLEQKFDEAVFFTEEERQRLEEKKRSVCGVVERRHLGRRFHVKGKRI